MQRRKDHDTVHTTKYVFYLRWNECLSKALLERVMAQL